MKPLIIALAVVVGCAPDADTGAARWEIVNPSPAPADEAIVAILFRSGVLRCTGTLISPQVVLTAAHCGVIAWWDYQVFIGEQLGGAGVSIDVVDAQVHPRFDGVTFANDLALLFLREPAPVAPKVLSTQPLDSAIGSAARVVGYGVTSAHADDAGTRRQGIAEIGEVLASEIVLAPSPSQPCVYDSGGPVFVTVDGVEVLAGVTSRGDAACASYARAARVDADDGVIASYLAETAPGQQDLGERCLYDAHCRTGSCLAADDEPRIRYCSRECADDTECGSLACVPAADGRQLCQFPLPTPGAPGATCEAPSDCFDLECVTGVCAPSCSPQAQSCPGDLTCTQVDNIRFKCLPPAPSAACSAAPGAGAWWIVVLVLYLAASNSSALRKMRSRIGSHSRCDRL